MKKQDKSEDIVQPYLGYMQEGGRIDLNSCNVSKTVPSFPTFILQLLFPQKRLIIYFKIFR